jgi:glucan phosphoethanolaminetransferase (alkaline phosphatase superfamily)
VRSGCLGLVVSIGIVSFSAVLAAVSLALIGSFAVSALGQPSGATTVLGLLIASVAGFCFFLVGRNIWRELREGRKGPGDRQE